MNMMRLFALAAISMIGVSGAASAHHSHAMFDDSREVTVSGTVTAWRFANPHVYLLMDGVVGDEEARPWAIELSHIGNMLRRGVTGSTFEPGQEVMITVNPLRNGQSGGNYTRIESINGVQNVAEDGQSWEPAQ